MIPAPAHSPPDHPNTYLDLRLIEACKALIELETAIKHIKTCTALDHSIRYYARFTKHADALLQATIHTTNLATRALLDHAIP